MRVCLVIVLWLSSISVFAQNYNESFKNNKQLLIDAAIKIVDKAAEVEFKSSKNNKKTAFYDVLKAKLLSLRIVFVEEIIKPVFSVRFSAFCRPDINTIYISTQDVSIVDVDAWGVLILHETLCLMNVNDDSYALSLNVFKKSEMSRVHNNMFGANDSGTGGNCAECTIPKKIRAESVAYHLPDGGTSVGGGGDIFEILREIEIIREKLIYGNRL